MGVWFEDEDLVSLELDGWMMMMMMIWLTCDEGILIVNLACT